MIRIHRFRPEDYWLLMVSFFAVLFLAVMLYAGTLQLRLLGAILGIPGLIFTGYIMRRSYSVRRAQFHVVACLVASAGLAYGAFLLTN